MGLREKLPKPQQQTHSSIRHTILTPDDDHIGQSMKHDVNNF
jgi:hypothetical protein